MKIAIRKMVQMDLICRLRIVSTAAVNFSTESNNVLLQTVCAKITNERECHFGKVRILFHSGSQRSYLNEHVTKKLNV